MEQAKKSVAKPVVREKQDAQAPKMTQKLVVTINDLGMPSFNFTGDWRGKDVALIIRLVRREYWKYNLKLRRQGHR